LNFLEFSSRLDQKLKERVETTLLEVHYKDYLFGSGFYAFRVRGKIFKLNFDGKEFYLILEISKEHDKYPARSYDQLYAGIREKLDDAGIDFLISMLDT
jgi:hypothetical protein